MAVDIGPTYQPAPTKAPNFSFTLPGKLNPAQGTKPAGAPGGNGLGSGFNPASAAMPVDAAGGIGLQQAAAARQTFLDSLNQSIDLTKQNYQEQAHDLRAQHPLDQEAVNDSYGSAGLGFSGGYGIANGQLQDVYQKNTDRLLQARTDALATDRQNREDYSNEYGIDLAGIRQAAADRLSANAGQLNLGKATGNGQTLAQLIQGLS